MKPKQFIQVVLIDEIKDIVDNHPYLAFTLIAIGIEFIGKCMLSEYKEWHKIKPEKAFRRGNELLVMTEPRYKSLNLKNELRDGFAHSLIPKSRLELSEVKYGIIHFSKSKKGKTILVIENLYEDFVKACTEVINTEFPEEDKMNQELIYAK